MNLEARLDKLMSYWSEYNQIQSELETILDDEMEDRVWFEEMFFDLIAKIKLTIKESTPQTSIIATPTPPLPSASTPVEGVAAMHHVRLPKIDLPKFSGDYGDWFPFQDVFNTMINENPQLSNIQKFQYLKSSVTGEAADVIHSLE